MKAADIIKGDNLPAIPVSNSSMNSTNSTVSSIISASASLPVSLASHASATGDSTNATAAYQSRAVAGLTMNLLRSSSTPDSISLSVSATASAAAVSSQSTGSVTALERLATTEIQAASSAFSAAELRIPSDVPSLATSGTSAALSPSPATTTALPVRTTNSPAEEGLSQSFIQALDSLGVPSSIVNALESVTDLPSSPTAGSSTSTESADVQKAENELNAVDSLVQWLASFFGQSRTS